MEEVRKRVGTELLYNNEFGSDLDELIKLNENLINQYPDDSVLKSNLEYLKGLKKENEMEKTE